VGARSGGASNGAETPHVTGGEVVVRGRSVGNAMTIQWVGQPRPQGPFLAALRIIMHVSFRHDINPPRSREGAQMRSEGTHRGPPH